jgi:hypothetical protein
MDSYFITITEYYKSIFRKFISIIFYNLKLIVYKCKINKKITKIFFSNYILLPKFSSIYCQYDSLFFDGMRRYNLVHLLQNFNEPENIKHPLILVLHGGFVNSKNI